MSNITVRLPDSVYMDIRLAAASERKSMNQYLKDLIMGSLGGEDENGRNKRPDKC